MAAKGYVVLYPNPRGSTSYGQDFGNIIQYHYPGDDYKDLMAGVDEVLKRGYVDRQETGRDRRQRRRVLTNWTIGHTNRFAAAVSQRDIATGPPGGTRPTSRSSSLRGSRRRRLKIRRIM